MIVTYSSHNLFITMLKCHQRYALPLVSMLIMSLSVLFSASRYLSRYPYGEYHAYLCTMYRSSPYILFIEIYLCSVGRRVFMLSHQISS
ncbi:hypothetical protein F5B19DRAFT_455898 [Rostrohypoxylon terebratum]|nr:hypothetical protein F5B19DRAFT_455898 [Rostrohypoxylon terebratum]